MRDDRFELPDAVLAMADRGPDWAAWVDALPRLTAGVLAEWELTPDGATAHGHTAMVVPVRTGPGAPAALKLGWPHDEGEHEHLALQHWHGDGAVRLLRADPGRSVMLLERLHTSDLTHVWDVEACEIVAGLYRRLHVPAPPQLRTLSSYVDRWTDDLARLTRSAPLPRRLVEQAVALGRELTSGTGDAGEARMLHTDLHYENVLAADREPWLVIDPKPVSGDPHYEVAPLLWNRWDELGEGYRGIRDGVRLRFHTVVDAAGLDEARARAWVVVRMLHNALWELEDAESQRRAPDAGYLTKNITAAKAVQD